MSEIMVRERFLRSGKKVYEYSFEMASVDGKRKRKSKSGFASKRDARIAGRKALSEYENVGQVMVDRDISYADFLDLWMENDCKLTCKESTLYGYEKKIRLYLKPELWGYRVSSISSHNVGCPKHDGGELKGRLGKYGPYVTCTCGHTLKPHDI